MAELEMMEAAKLKHSDSAVTRERSGVGTGSRSGSGKPFVDVDSMNIISSYGGYDSVNGGQYHSSTEPLLPKSSGYWKDIGSIANIMSIILTCNMFSFPWSFYQTGICYGTVILISSASVSCITALSLHRSQQQVFLLTGKVTNYCEIAQYYLGGGWWLSSSIQVATAISCFGGCIGFYIFIGQILSQLLQISLLWANALLFPPLVFLSLSRSFKDLSIYTIMSVFSFILVIVVMYQDAFISWYMSDSTHAHIHLPKNDSFKNIPESGIIIEFIGNATFLFAIHYCLLSQAAEDLEEEMKLISVDENSYLLQSGNREYVEKCRAHIKTSGTQITISFILSTCVSILVGITGHFFAESGTFIRDAQGDILPGCEAGVCENIILNIPAGIQRNVTNIFLIISTMISYALLLAPVREYIETQVLEVMIKPYEFSALHTHRAVNLLRVMMVLTTAVIATKAPYFADVLGTVGGITDSYLAYILPALIMIMVLRRSPSSNNNSPPHGSSSNSDYNEDEDNNTNTINGQMRNNDTDGKGMKMNREYPPSEQSKCCSCSPTCICPTFAVGLFYFICGWGVVLAGSTIYGLLVNIYDTMCI